MQLIPLIPAKAGIQSKEKWRLTLAQIVWQRLGPLRPNNCLADLRGDERLRVTPGWRPRR
jgi:hypothetical protein